jgi:Cd2+/Zn2+-exporting ATPase
LRSSQLPLQFKIVGMDCAEEVAVLKREVGPVVGGVHRLAFDILNGKMTIQPPASEVTPEVIIRAVARTGMRAEIWQDAARDLSSSESRQRHGRTITTILSGVLAIIGFMVHVVLSGGVGPAIGSEGLGVVHDVPLAARLPYLLAIMVALRYVLPKAWRAARRLRPDMNLLMTVAVVGAIGIGEWFEAATVAFLFALSLDLESWTVGRARRAVAALMELAPLVARLRKSDGTEEQVPPEQVPVGAHFIVVPGEKLPLDGTVVSGFSEVNQAPITGESAPVPKQPGGQVFAGTINGDGVLEVECTKPAGDTTLAHIISLVAEAQSRRAPSEQWVEKFARVYTPLVMGLAFAFLVVPPLFFSGDWGDWFYRSLVLLVIACPCALVISTPVSIVAALSAAARNGVLIKGGTYVEAPARLRAIAFDKTGTLTEGKPRVLEVVPLSGHDERELLERVAAIESRSDHPLAQAIVAYVKERGVEFKPADDLQIIQGKGATARFSGKRYWLGSHRYLEERGQENEDVHRRLESMSQGGRTVVAVGNEDHVCGLIALADAVRPKARQTLQTLRKAGLQRIVMLTGDNRETALAIAVEAGVDEVHAELLPADKMTAVEKLVAKYGNAAMVGDGVNDAPALGRASVGIAMGAAGSDAAIETADIALMSDDLSKLPWLVQHSRQTLAIIRQNIAFSLSVKALFVVLTFSGYASLWAAIAADMGVSLLVVFNALRLVAIRHSSG